LQSSNNTANTTNSSILVLPQSNLTIAGGNKSSIIVPQSNITVTTNPRPIPAFQLKAGPIITAIIVIPFTISAILAAIDRTMVAKVSMIGGFVFLIVVMVSVIYITNKSS
jgi:hypothetical protein